MTKSRAVDPKVRRALVAAADVEEALRCTGHIPERDIRARYIAMQLEIEGYTLLKRGPDGRFQRTPAHV